MQRKEINLKNKNNIVNQFIFLSPMLLCFIPIVVIPFFYAIFISFFSWNGISATKVFVWFKNFKTIFTIDSEYWKSILFSAKSSLAITVISNVLGLALALLVSSIPRKLRGISRTLLLLPNIMGGVIMGFIWRFIFQKGFSALAKIPGLGFLAKSWLGDAGNAFWAIVIVAVWQYAGYTMIIYIAGLSCIDQSIKDATKIDGCSSFREFFSVTLPLIMPSITICTFWVLVKSFTMYDLTSALTDGGPYGSTMTASMNLYFEAFSKNNYGLGSAKAVVFSIFILIISLAQVKFTRSMEVEQ